MELNESQLCRKIRWLRELRGYTQQFMAIELDISARAYSKIEAGETRLSVKRLYQIADILKLSVHEILLLDENEMRRLRWEESQAHAPISTREEVKELRTLLDRLLKTNGV